MARLSDSQGHELQLGGNTSLPVTVVGSLSNVVTVSATRPNNATPYTALDVVGTDAATNMEFATGLTSGSVIAITQAMLTIKIGAIPSGMSGFVLHLFNAAPTAITDNLAYNLIAADVAKYLGSITLNAPTDLGDNLVSDNPNLGKIIKLSTASVFVVLQTLGGYTPSASTVKDLTLAFVAV